VASSEALDVLHWAMHPTSYHHRTHIVIKTARNFPALFFFADFVVWGPGCQQGQKALLVVCGACDTTR
jgi:hypothetical protein